MIFLNIPSSSFFEEISCSLFAATKDQVVVDLANTLDLVTFFTSLLGVLIMLDHLLILGLDAFLEALVVLLTSLDDLSHPFSL
jgi:hypothetical protein